MIPHPNNTPRTRVSARLRFRVRICCAVAFFLCGLMPVYVPHSASSAAPEHYLTNSQFLLVEEGFVMKTASITEQGYRIAYGKGISHHVGSGESLSFLADLYGISTDTILWANNMDEEDVLHPGDSVVVLPVDGVLHTVRRGQNPGKIADLYDISLEDILAQNQIEKDTIYPGQQIIIPGGEPLIESEIAARSPSDPSSGRGDIKSDRPRPIPPPSAKAPASFGILQKPCDCVYTQYYHPGHYALDMANKAGTPIFAAEDGIITRADYGWNGGYGYVIEIDHGNNLRTLYAHNKKLHIREGQTVRRGDVIATIGNTGRVYGQTGIHLHFEVILNGIKKNPLLYLQ